MEQEIKGSFSYRNWKAYLFGVPTRLTFEFPLFTDAHMIGEIMSGFGPYQIINNLSFVSSRPALILRTQEHLEYEIPQMNKTQDEFYHGGNEADELAALLSLCLGIPLKAGGASRVFGRDADPMGTPISYFTIGDDPVLPLSRGRKILDTFRKECSLDNARLLSNFPLLSFENAIALVRAARLYQDALWSINSTPELSWIMLTSAVETVAQEWRKEKVSPLEDLLAYNGELEFILRKYAKKGKGDQLVVEIADKISSLTRATKKFVDFALEFLPPPPSIRPPEWAQLSWEKPKIKKTLSIIYDYRSRALHGGKPFPAPMCEPPMSVGDDGQIAEIPTSLAMSMKGGVWVAKDTPLLLHTFEYIVRNAILNWWKSSVPVLN